MFLYLLIFMLFFFSQAEDGIRDRNVTGVQTCALPISKSKYTSTSFKEKIYLFVAGGIICYNQISKFFIRRFRSEERRVGKESRYRSSSSNENNTRHTYAENSSLRHRSSENDRRKKRLH